MITIWKGEARFKKLYKFDKVVYLNKFYYAFYDSKRFMLDPNKLYKERGFNNIKLFIAHIEKKKIPLGESVYNV